MAVVGRTTTKWLNADGLLVALRAKDEAVAERTGGFAYPADGEQTVVKLSLDLTSLATVSSGNELILSDSVTIPNGAMIQKVKVIVTEVTAGTNSTLDLGLVDQDRSTELDFDGFLANATTTWHTAAIGTTVEYVAGTSQVGALVGTVLTNTGLITASADTADFTDGVLSIEIFYTIPLAADL